ncbi:MAG: hypothetical protein K6E59_05360 [Bacilli bacterium]|nr:hypothetical protein [Bacilli bacterium]
MQKSRSLGLCSLCLLFLASCSAPATPVSDSSSSAPEYPFANGAFDYRYVSGREANTLTGKLEKYAIENHIAPLTLYGDGNYALVHPSVIKGTVHYIPDYGFGILREGTIVGDLEGEENPEWARYYHTHVGGDPKKINAMNDKGSTVGELASYVNAPYFLKQKNAGGDGYDWVGGLSSLDRPIPLAPNANGLTKNYRVQVKVGEDAKYGTLSEKYAKYDGREVALEDYVTPFKILYTAAYGMARGRDNLLDRGSFEGILDYYEASKDGFNPTVWEKVGIKACYDAQDEKPYIQFTFNQALSTYEAMTYLANAMYAPVPESFIEDIGDGDFATGVARWGVFANDESIVDHWLSTGPYALQRWDKDRRIVFKRNAHFADEGHYRIQGAHVAIITEEAAFQAFLDRKLHQASVPYDKVNEYFDDPRLVPLASTGTRKLNMNTCDAERWEALFGKNGTICQTEEKDYWQVEPAMSNDDFLQGLSFALDRATLAKKNGHVPCGAYLPDSYMADPESGISYNLSQAHKDAVSSLFDGTDGYGYSLQKASNSFKKAAEKLIGEGVYKEGDTIEIEIAWTDKNYMDKNHAPIAKMLMDAFNLPENPLKLKVVSWIGDVWSDVYYKKLMKGQFDLGYGTISGSAIKPFLYFDVLRSDNRSGFTLNWGVDTNGTESLVQYDGLSWSYDALLSAATNGAYVRNGQEAMVYELIEMGDSVRHEDGSLTISTVVETVECPNASGGWDIKTETSKVALYAGSIEQGTYTEFAIDHNGHLSVTDNASSVVVDERDLGENAFMLEKGPSGLEHALVTFPADVVSAIAEIAKAEYGKESYACDLYRSETWFGSYREYVYTTSVGPFDLPEAALIGQ